MDKKEFKQAWELIEIPVIVMVVWSVISLAITLENIIGIIASNIINWLITIGAFSYVGFVCIKKKKELSFSAKHGALAGAISGFFGAIISIIWMYIVPSRFDSIITQMVASGVAEQTAQTLLRVGLFFGLVTGPLINALIGTLIALASAWIVKKIILKK